MHIYKRTHSCTYSCVYRLYYTKLHTHAFKLVRMYMNFKQRYTAHFNSFRYEKHGKSKTRANHIYHFRSWNTRCNLVIVHSRNRASIRMSTLFSGFQLIPLTQDVVFYSPWNVQSSVEVYHGFQHCSLLALGYYG